LYVGITTDTVVIGPTHHKIRTAPLGLRTLAVRELCGTDTTR